ncbi:MAG: DNA cytosine methyltransferase [Sedimentisphaerales bacterium]|nr:DNA cytosine methyltransferase [Sedimentisphaerales bacterium]
MKRVRAIDLFCGAGGSSWGAQQAGVEIVAGFDMWETAESVYRDNFPKAAFYGGRIEDHNPLVIARELGKIDLIMASPECTNHSVAKGNKPRCEKSRETALLVTRFAEAFKPRWIIIENVVSMRNWDRYTELIEGIVSLGYNTSVEVLNSADFGVPQSRRRMFVVFDRERKPETMVIPRRRVRTAGDIINQNGTYSYSPLRTKRRASATRERAKRAISSLGPNNPFLIVYYGTDQIGGWQNLDVPSSQLRYLTSLRWSGRSATFRLCGDDDLQGGFSEMALQWRIKHRH